MRVPSWRPNPRAAALSLALALAVFAACRKHKLAAADVPLTQAYPSPNQLLTAHYPADFSASIVGKNVVLLQRQPQGEIVVLLPVETPVSPDFAETSRVMMLAEDKELAGYKETSRKSAPCFAGVTGIVREGQWNPSPVSTSYRWMCIFPKSGHVYRLSYDVPQYLRADDEPLLQKIVAATEIK
jgi:hypothetical protein